MAPSRAPAMAATTAAAPPPPPPPPSKLDYGTLLPTTPAGQAEAAAAAIGAAPKRRLVPGWACLVLFVLLYSANNAVLAKFLARGLPFTICGIMCVGNFLGCLSLYPVFWRQITWAHVRKVTAAQWGWMLLGCLLANVLGSAAYLQGLKLTSVPARAMTGRLESVDFLLASALFLGDAPGAWVRTNALLTVAGVAAAVSYPILMQHGGGGALHGYLYLVAGGWGYTLSLIVTKRFLVHIPVGLLSLFKLALGTILFHVLARLPSHHANDSSEAQTQPEMGLYSWELWASMLWYAPLFVTSTMVLWLRALKLCSPALLSVGMNSNFVMTVLFGILIVGKWPTTAELIGGGFILLSIVSGIAETTVNGDGGEARDEKRLRRGQAEKPIGGVFPPAASPADALELETGKVATGVSPEEEEEEEEEKEEGEEDETARLVHRHKPQPHHHLGFDSLEEGDGVGIHPFS